nr:hypothetical protein [Tanacetum cinerariifolium]
MDEEKDDEVTKELYKDVNVNQGKKDADMTNADQRGADQQNVSQYSSEITSATTVPLPPPSFNPLQQEATPTPTPTTLETTTSVLALLDFAFYAKALSSITAIMDCYMDTKLGEAINKAIQAHNFNCKEEAQAKKKEYIKLVDSTVKTIIKEEVNTQLPQILPQAISYVATLVIEKNVTESLEVAVSTRSSSQPHSLHKAATTLFEFELTKIPIDKMEKNKSFDIADNKRELYDALVKSYNTDKDIFESYGEVFSLKRSQDDKDKDQDSFIGSDQGMKRRKLRKEAKPSKDSRRYSTFVTKTKAATYELKWIEDLVHELWSPVQLKYDQ